MKKLNTKPCPFCGGKASWWDTEDNVYPYQIMCNTCHCGTDAMADKDDALTTWNRRSPIDDIVERLEKLKEWGYAELMPCEVDELIDKAIEIVKGGIG